MAQWYPLLKHLHMTLVFFSLLLFFARASMSIKGIDWHGKWPWLKVLPHINDSLLLLSGITLAIIIRQYPFAQLWISIKILLLLCYIGLGIYVLRIAKNKVQQITGTALALFVISWMVVIARTKQVWPF